MTRLLLSFLILTLCGHLFSQETLTKKILQGKYQGKNIYVMNPARGGGFCITKVVVNGHEANYEISSAIVIALDSMKFKIGDSLKVEIFHHLDCNATVINTDNGNPRSTFEVTNIKVSPEGLLTWETKNEYGKLPYTIEQFMWNKWVAVGEVDGKGNEFENEYRFQLTPHSGENKVRVKQLSDSKAKFSNTISFSSLKKENNYGIDSGRQKISFQDNTFYEVFDSGGNMLKKGFGNELDAADLKKNVNYHLNYDNKTVEIKFKDKANKKKSSGTKKIF